MWVDYMVSVEARTGAQRSDEGCEGLATDANPAAVFWRCEWPSCEARVVRSSFTGCRESPVLLRATAAMADVDAKLYTSVGAYDLRAAGGRPGPAVGTLLRSTGLDVYLLQGVGAEQMHTLAPYLSEKYHLIHYLHPDATLKDGVAIALRRERLEPVSSRSLVFWGRTKPGAPIGSFPANRAAGAIVCAVERASGVRLAFATADLDDECIEPEQQLLFELRALLRPDASSAGRHATAPLSGRRSSSDDGAPSWSADACVWGCANGSAARRADAPAGYVAAAPTARGRTRDGESVPLARRAPHSRLYFSEGCAAQRTALTERFVAACSRPLGTPRPPARHHAGEAAAFRCSSEVLLAALDRA